MKNINIIKNIKPIYSKQLILSRLGYKKQLAEISQSNMEVVDQTIEFVADTIEVVLAYRIVKIIGNNDSRVMLEDGTELFGEKLSRLLENSSEAVLMAATGGNKIMNIISALQVEGRMSEAVIADAAASEITDSALDFLMTLINQTLRPQGKFLTKMRFSPGYGDFNLAHQRDLFRLLEAENIGLKLNDALLIIPEKSVLAIAGIVGR